MADKNFGEQDNPQPGESTAREKPLQSWKEIAAYLDRDERTARRWEKKEGLPVRRHREEGRSSVYAYPSELSAWRGARKPRENEHRPWWSRPLPVAGAVVGIAGAVLVIWLVRYGPILSPPNPLIEASEGITMRQVWTGPEVDIGARPSRDGRFLAYSELLTGDVAIRDLAAGEVRTLTSDASRWGAGGWAGYPLFSPDGLQVAYEWGQWDSELRVVARDGSDPRVLLPARRDWWIVPCDWSSDGRHILVHYYHADANEPSQIAMVRVEDGSLQVVKTLDSRQPRGSQNLWFSPDGRYIVYDHLPQGARNERDIAIVSADGALESSLVQDPADDYVLGWSPDGRSIMFASNRSGDYGVWATPVTEGQPSGVPRLLRRDTGPIRPIGLTDDGILFYAQTGAMTMMDQDIFSAEVDLELGRIIGSPRLEVGTFRGLNSFPDWSPDGRYLAYVSGRPDSKSYVVSIRDEEKGEDRELPVAVVRFEDLRWAPDGESLLALGTDSEQHTGLFRVDAQTGEVQSILQATEVIGAGVDAQWLPDGRRLVYALNARWPAVLAKIIVRDSETGVEQEILRMEDLQLIGFLALSPDGNTLAFSSFRLEGGPDGGAPTNITLTVMPASGGETTQLLEVGFPELIGNLAWTPDSRSILCVVRTGGESAQQAPARLWQIPASGGEPRDIGSVPNIWMRQRLTLQPKGRRITYTRYERKFEIWAMEGLLAETSAE